MASLTDAQARRVLSLTSVDAVKQFLTDIDADSPKKWKWLPLGGRENNAGSVQLAVEPGQALVERVTNALDAQIELQYELAGQPSGLTDPRTAVAHLWRLDTGRLTRSNTKSARFIDEMAPKTVLRAVASGDSRDPTIIVEDSGIGQHPEQFSNTLLSLGETNKISQPHLMGAFGQGGSSTFAFCPFSVVVSRRHRGCASGFADRIGWTIVRKFDADSLKVFRYEYLVDEFGQIPSLGPDQLKALGSPFNPGTRIAHVGYELDRLRTAWSIVGYRYFNNLLFDPVLPYRIEDHRTKPHFNRNMYGARNRLDQYDPDIGPEAQNYEIDTALWGGEGRLKMRYWFFKPTPEKSKGAGSRQTPKLDSFLDYDRSPRTIIFTLNGQRHHTEQRVLVRSRNMGALADNLLIHVECDDLSLRLKKEIFLATRAGTTAGGQRGSILLNAVREALSNRWLRQKNDEVVRSRQQMIVDASQKTVRRMLDSLITTYRTQQLDGGHKGQGKGGSSRSGDAKRRVKDPPSYLRFADHRPLEIESGKSTTFFLQTDGPDDLLGRRRRSAQIKCEGDGTSAFSVGDITHGRVAVRMDVPSSVQPGHRERLVATLDLPPSTYLSDTRQMRVVPPAKPFVGTDPPTVFQFARDSEMSLVIGGKSTADIKTDAPNDILDRPVGAAIVEAECDIPGTHIAFAGPNNGILGVQVHSSSETSIDSQGVLTVTLKLPNGDSFDTSRPCRTAAPNENGGRRGEKKPPVPAYQVIPVWKSAPPDDPDAVTWSSFTNPWDEAKIGSWEKNGEELHLFVNIDESQFSKEKIRLRKGRLGPAHVDRQTNRYQAYVAFHLFQLHDQPESQNRASSSTDGNDTATSIDANLAAYDPDSTEVVRELQRVSTTLIQTLKSEAQLHDIEHQFASEG